MIIDSPIISGSYAASGSLNQVGNVVISGSLTITGGITGSISGSAISASYAANATSASYALTSSFSLNVPVTASYANNANSASFATTASNALTASYLSGYVSPFPFTGSAIISGSFTVTGSANIPNITGSLSGSLNGTASYAVTASNAVTASYLTGYVSPFPFTGSAIISGSLGVSGSLQVTNLSGSGVRYLVADESGSVTAQSASSALKATQEFTSTAGQTTFSVTNGYATGYVDVFINGSKLSTSEFTDTSGTNIVLATGSFSGDVVEVVKYTPAAGVTNNVLRQLTTLTGSAGQTVFSASYTPGLLDIFYNGSRLSTSDYTANNGTYFTLATGSADNDILDVLVYSYQVGAFSGIGGQGVTNQLVFFNTTSSITGSNSFTVSGNTLVGTASYASNADTLDGSHLSILATTGSNTFTSAQYISNTSAPIGFTDTASLYTDGGLRATKTSYFSSSVYIGGDLIIFGTQSVNYITSSQLNIADNIITVNTSSPAVRFGGIAVQDSGSLATGLTGSLLWDSQNNHWIYTNPSGSSYSGGMMISGPRASSLGEEQGTTNNALMKGQGGDHITSSAVFEVSGSVGIGTTPSAWASPFTAIQGGTWGQHIAFQSNTADVKLGANNYYNGTNYLYYTSSQGAAQFNVAGAGGFQFNIAPTGTAGATVNFTASMVITTAGNVGIGTSSPAAQTQLHLVNTSNSTRFRMEASNPTYAALLDFTSGSTPRWSIGIDNSQAYGKLENRILATDAIRFYDSTNNVVLVPSSGNVFIAGTSQLGSSKLSVFGPIAARNSGVDATYAEAFTAYYSSNNTESNAILTAVSSAAGQSGFRFDVSNGAGSAARTTALTLNRASATFSGPISIGNTITVGNQGGVDTTVITGGSGYGSKVQWNSSGGVACQITGNTDSYVNLFTGNFGIGKSNPAHKLDVAGDINIPGTNRIIFNNEPGSWGITARTTTSTANLGANLKNIIICGGGSNEGIAFTGVGTGAAAMEVRNDGAVWVKGTLTKGGGSFRIDHPLPEKKDTHHLYHSFIEGPKADLIYRGKINLVNGTASVNIDEVSTMTEGTFELLTRDAQCFVNNLSGWDLVKGNITENILTIISQNTESTDEISWMVVAERNDEWFRDSEMTDDNGNTIVEKLKPAITE